MNKDFDAWNKHKKLLEYLSKSIIFKEADIWWCSIGVNVSNESSGKGEYFMRPVLIIKKLSSEAFIGIPVSTKNKKGSWFVDINVNGQKQCALLYQIRMFNINRLQRRLAILDTHDFAKVKEKLEDLLEFS